MLSTGDRSAGQHRPALLCADDYAIAEGVSRGILDIAAAGRLSAVSAIVTLPRWREDAAALQAVADSVAVGLHLNLTLGPGSRSLRELATAGALGTLDAGEIEAEILRQVDAFANGLGRLPEFVDGHQHVHVLPGVRRPLRCALNCRFAPGAVLVRNPADRPADIIRRGGAVAKALGVAVLGAGFAGLMRGAGFLVNEGFAGFSRFDARVPYAAELDTFFRASGARHLIMCHPGYPDTELSRLDPVTERRRQELDAIAAYPGLQYRIWHKPGASGLLAWADGG